MYPGYAFYPNKDQKLIWRTSTFTKKKTKNEEHNEEN